MTRPDRARHDDRAVTTALTVPGRWAERALCAQSDPDTWFPDQNPRAFVKLAKQICARCPVRAECLQYALSGADTWKGITTGVWGGTTPRERDQIRRRRKAAA